jgi:hypothetical protein
VSRPAAGYSGTPLWQKLGLKPRMRVIVLNRPADLEALLVGGPTDLDYLGKLATFDFALAFATSSRAFGAALAKLEPRLATDGMIWAAWPKKASGVATDLGEEAVRGAGLALGLVDVKVCAIDTTWSGLKLVRRLRDRQTRT